MFRVDCSQSVHRTFSHGIAVLSTLALFAIGASAAVTLAAVDPLFVAPYLSFDAGTSPFSVAIADLNGDGRLDLAVANLGSWTVSVLLGNGNGTFGAKTDFSTGSQPTSVAIADLNGDGRPDLAVANSSSSTVSVLLGNGDGTFRVKTDFDTGNQPHSVSIADLNGDGRPDLVVATFSNTVSVLLGNGDGTFRAKTDFSTGSQPKSVAIADLNADGRPDLAVANQNSSTVSVLLGNGDGTFGAKTDFGTGFSPQSVAIADLNADGRPDLAVANYSLGTVSVLLGNGNGTFGAKTDFAGGGSSTSVAIADLNGDGQPDVAVANQYSNTVSVLLGNGDGTFGAKTDFDAGRYSLSVAIADLNGDGRPDLAVANGQNTVSVLLGNGDGTFGATDFGAGSSPYSGAISDLNGDGRPDLAVANWGSNTVSVLLGNGNGTFGAKTDFSTGSQPTSVAIEDLNADGRPDLAVANQNSSSVSVLLGNGDGTFGAKTDFGTGFSPQSVAIADLNADGRPDLAVANSNSNTVSVLLGNGNGTFGAKNDFASGGSSTSVVITDLDGDGRPDLAVANSSSNTVSVLLGNGDGTFRVKTDFWTAGNAQFVAIADLNADGVPDLAVARPNSNTVQVLLGDGDGTFEFGTNFGTGFGPYSVSIADLNGDGRPDLAVANSNSNTVSVLLGSGNGTFGAKTDFGAGGTPYSVAIADLNADGRPDLATANYSSNTVSVLMNTGAVDSAPALLSPADGSTIYSSPQFVWRGIGSAASYSVVVATDPLLQSPVKTFQLPAGSTGCQYTGAPLSPGVGYYWSVRALVSGRWTSYAPPWRFTRASGASSLAAPTLTAPSNLASVGLPETFSWSAVTSATSYRMKIGSDPALSSPLWVSGVSTMPSLEVPPGIPSVVVGSTYYWTATGIDATGLEGLSAPPFAFVLSASSVPPAQPVLVAPADGATVNTSVVAFVWNQPNGATRYRLVYSTSNSFSTGSNKTWVLDGLTQTTAQVILPGGDVTLFWKVIPSNSTGTGPESAVRSFHYLQSTGPLTGVVIENPAGNVKFGLNSSVSATARIIGQYGGSVQGTWKVDGTDWQSFSFVPADAQHISTESPPLPTGQVGSHTIQCVVTSPSTVTSVAQPFEVVNRPPGLAASVSVAVLPSSLPADGSSQATLTASIVDAGGVLVSTDTGRIMSASASGPASLNPTGGTSSSGQWTSTLTAGSTEGVASLTITAASLPAATTRVPLWADPLAGLKAEARAYLDSLKTLHVPGPLNVWSYKLCPQAYDVGEAERFVDNAGVADTAAVARLLVFSRALLRFYHYDPGMCTEYCGGNQVPGAFTLVDDASDNLVSLASQTFGLVKVLEDFGNRNPAFSKKWVASTAGKLVDHLDQVVQTALDAVPNGLSPDTRAAIVKGIAESEKAINAWLDDTYGKGDLFADILDPVLRAPANAVVLGKNYVGANSQAALNQAVTMAQGPIIKTAAQAWNNAEVQVSGAKITSQSYDDASTTFKNAGDAWGIGASIADLVGTGIPVWALIATVTSLTANFWAVWNYKDGMSTAWDGYEHMKPMASRLVQGVFGTPPAAATLSKTHEAATAQFAAHPPSTALWARLLTTQSDFSTGFDALARELALSVQAGDGTRTSYLLDRLIDAADSLDAATDMAVSPVSAAANEGLYSVAGFDSMRTLAARATESARGARLQLTGAALSYLYTPADPIARQQVLDAVDVAIGQGIGAKQAVSDAVTSLFTTPAVPYVRVSQVLVPDSITVGRNFRVQAVCSNLGAGTAEGAFAQLKTDSAMVILGPDSLALPSLAPGDTASVGWTILAVRVSAADTLAHALALIQLGSTCSNGLGENRSFMVPVSIPPTTGVAGPAAGAWRLQLAVAPNPASSAAGFYFSLPVETEARLDIFDLAGRRCATPAAGRFDGGTHQATWRGELEAGGKAQPGIYWARLTTPRGTLTKNFVWQPR